MALSVARIQLQSQEYSVYAKARQRLRDSFQLGVLFRSRTQRVSRIRAPYALQAT